MMLKIKPFYLKLCSLFLLPFFQQFLLAVPLLLRKKININYDQDRIKIQIILFLLILYLFVYDIIFKQLNYHSLLTLTPFFFLLFSSFLKINTVFLSKIRRCVYIIFFLDFSANILSVFLNLDIYGEPVFYFKSAYHSLKGIFGHPYISVALGAITFLYASLFKDKRMMCLSLLGLFLSSSLRSLLLLFPILVSSYILSKAYRFLFIPLVLILGMVLILQFVKLDSNGALIDHCKLNIHNNSYYDCKSLNSSALRSYAWTSFAKAFPQIYLTGYGHREARVAFQEFSYDKVDRDKIFESPYFQYTFDYGIPFSILLVSLFLLWMHNSYNNYFKSNRNTFKKRLHATKLAISSLFFFDSFYGTFFFSIVSYTTLQFILFLE